MVLYAPICSLSTKKNKKCQSIYINLTTNSLAYELLDPIRHGYIVNINQKEMNFMANDKKQPLATVNGKNIYADNLDELIMVLPPQQAMQFQSREGRRGLLNELIAQELFYNEALENGLKDTEEFQAIIKDAEEKLLKSTAIANFMKDIDVDEEAVHQFYEDHPEEFVAPEQIRASHILVDSEDQAKEIIDEINNGLAFEEAAQKYSSCPSAQAGGDLNFFQRGQMVPPFEQAAFALEDGEMTAEPVQTNFGYHIIKKTDHHDNEQIPYELVKDSIKQLLLAEKQQAAFDKHVDELKDKYPVELNLALI